MRGRQGVAGRMGTWSVREGIGKMTARKRPLWRTAVIVFGLLLLAVGPVAASPPPTRPADDPFKKPPELLGRDDFWRIAEMIVEEGTATHDEADALVTRLTPGQVKMFEQVIAEYLAEYAAKIGEDVPDAALPATPETPGQTGRGIVPPHPPIGPDTNTGDVGIMAFWRQLIEHHDPAKSVKASAYYNSANDCNDGDPDIEHIYYFASWILPDYIRWSADSWWVKQVLLNWPGYNGNLNGFGWTEHGLVYVCVGEGAANAATGADNVLQHLTIGSALAS